MKSDIEIAKFVYHKIKGTELECNVSGKLSDRGRPNKSDKEDIVISVLANEGCGQIQRAYVNIIYMSKTYGTLKPKYGKKIQSEFVNYANYRSFYSLYEKTNIIRFHHNAVKKLIQQEFHLKTDIQSISLITNCT